MLAELIDRLGAALVGKRGARLPDGDRQRAGLAQHIEHGLDRDIARFAEGDAAGIVARGLALDR